MNSDLAGFSLSRFHAIPLAIVSKAHHSLIKAFITYVRPLVEYASCVWLPGSVDLIRKIEAV